ncbi:DUF1524 domain-containing protein [Arthrobacter sp. ISL-28]|uniref:GmrSD restriction endonuclease domain-containing protein n=1 Tax=Arthrobacter sp. ISL-28 TaxID=2819108 RepID=UPI001BE98E69|nr:DUF1524 domain-containing protein [Arthrobacter sp. ISL-28]MBT2523688.1 DUF1524 domain-containing protein [Arthrobacter sp. ISL-28]
MSRATSSRRENGAPFGAVDWVKGSIVATAILATTACGGAVSATEHPTSGIQLSAPTAVPETASPSAGAVPNPARLDAETVPEPAGAADANAQPAFAIKALELLATLPIKGRAPKTGYDRAEFGQAWADTDRNGCDTRNDILARDLTAKTLKPGTRSCVVLSGALDDPYTARNVAFQRGRSTSSAVQIDHVVALSDAWQKGAQQLSEAQRTAFANDPLNLLAVSGPANQKKGDGDAATWLPSNKAYRCAYVARQISVKAAHKLWVTRAEHDAMSKVLAKCDGTLARTNNNAPATKAAAPPSDSHAGKAAQAPGQQAAGPAVVHVAPAPALTVAPAPAQAAPAATYYANCSAVRAAGAAPIFAGQPGYSAKLDRDGDGVGCE